MGTLSSSLRLARSQEGFILPIVLVLFAIGALLITPTLGHGYASLGASTVTEIKAEQLHAADSGVEEALYWLTRARTTEVYQPVEGEIKAWSRTTTYLINGQNVHVTIEHVEDEEEEHLYRITSRAEDVNGAGSTVLALVYAVPFINYIELDPDQPVTEPMVGDHFIVDGNLDLHTANASLTGNVTVYGALDLGQSSEIVGDVYATGDITLGQSSTIECEVICTEGNLYLGQTSEVTLIEDTEVDAAEIHFLNTEGSSLVLANKAHLTANIFSRGDLTVVMKHPDNSITGKIVVDGDLIIDMEDSNAQGTLTGNLYATGNVIIKLAHKAEIIGTLHYFHDKEYVQSGSTGATWPSVHVCTDEDPCDWPSPEFGCTLPIMNEAEIRIWEVT